jgi:hypothetical protein
MLCREEQEMIMDLAGLKGTSREDGTCRWWMVRGVVHGFTLLFRLRAPMIGSCDFRGVMKLLWRLESGCSKVPSLIESSKRSRTFLL